MCPWRDGATSSGLKIHLSTRPCPPLRATELPKSGDTPSTRACDYLQPGKARKRRDQLGSKVLTIHPRQELYLSSTIASQPLRVLLYLLRLLSSNSGINRFDITERVASHRSRFSMIGQWIVLKRSTSVQFQRPGQQEDLGADIFFGYLAV